ncbi:cellulose binding domain-containing protein [Amycolatopsis sp. NPDC051128]|uniref:cellulose binding domain-containing protein n=1 Tax=Amycolatopsis sp. NPDC051128 TaxID=3155412 RepID=UPI00341FE394
MLTKALTAAVLAAAVLTAPAAAATTPLRQWDYAAGQRVAQGWSGTWTQSGAHVTVDAPSWQADLAPGASAVTGFNGTFTGSNPAPTAFTLNGTACAVPTVN